MIKSSKSGNITIIRLKQMLMGSIMIISNTINDFFNNFHLNEQSRLSYFTKYHTEFQHAGYDEHVLCQNIHPTLLKLEQDLPLILKINTTLVHIIFEVRLKFLKQYQTYLKPDIYFLVGTYKEDASIQLEDNAHLYLFIESLCHKYDLLYDVIAYYLAKLYIYEIIKEYYPETITTTILNNKHVILEEAIVLHILKTLNYTYPYKDRHDFKDIQQLASKLESEFTTETILQVVQK